MQRKVMRGDYPLINIRKVLQYNPLFKQTKQNRDRYYKLDEIAVQYDLDIDQLHVDFAIFLAYIIKSKIQLAIKTQMINGRSFRSMYKPLSKSYKKKKIPKNKDKFWINTEFLVSNLSVYRAGRYGDVYIGFPQSVKHPSNKNISVQDIIMWNESKRPLFKIIVKSVAKNLNKNFHTFINKYIQNKGKLKV